MLGFTIDKLRQWPCPADPPFNRHRRFTSTLRPCTDALPSGISSGISAAPEPVATFDRESNGVDYTELGVQTAAVLAQARAHYDCVCGGDGGGGDGGGGGGAASGDGQCIRYMPLENSGGAGTASSHWEMRVMANEVRKHPSPRIDPILPFAHLPTPPLPAGEACWLAEEHPIPSSLPPPTPHVLIALVFTPPAPPPFISFPPSARPIPPLN